MVLASSLRLLAGSRATVYRMSLTSRRVKRRPKKVVDLRFLMSGSIDSLQKMVFQLYDAWKPDGCQPFFLNMCEKIVRPVDKGLERLKIVFD